MPRYALTPVLDPEPVMHDQRLSKRTGASFLPNIAIDPTCGRYALKALLKWHYRKQTGVTAEGVTLPRPSNPFKSLAAYDPENDFRHFGTLLAAPDNLPGTIGDYVDMLGNFGPLIANGSGVGKAGASVGHYILLVGADAATGTLYYKDPLRGDQLFDEPHGDLGPKIRWLCHGQQTIGQTLAALGQSQDYADMAFT
ncbi:papain-like cysteine protease family protein [Mangrovicoccus ximenensis]|uniref:papain-like cysteine protease family protein n=1 Tax=Mangrovicoccus ximenensis TaxID=1911570 RepID=UPI000D3549D7|nr:papain-like cysteine protease family protein [Mangrovicoccus ximenensis]